MQRFFGVSQDINGNAIPNVAVTVKLAGTATNATLYSDNAYTPLANPLTSNTDGTYQFFARNGTYDVTLFKTNYSFVAGETSSVLLDDDMSVISPAQIIANQNDYSPANALNATTWRLTTDADRTITGIAAGFSQQEVFLTNIGSFTIFLANQSGLSAAGNKFLTPTGANYSIGPNATARLVYDTSSAVWRVADLGVSLSVQTIFRDANPVSITNSGAETTIYSTTILGNTLSTNRCLRVTVRGRYTNTTGSPRGGRPRLKYGGTTVIDLNSITLTDTITAGAMNMHFDLAANNATNAQLGYVENLTQSTAAGNAGVQTTLRGTAAVDSTADQTLAITMTLSVGDPNLNYTRELVTVELL